MADKNIEKCAHPSCNCPPAKDGKFCSTLCEGNAGRPDIVCGCRHASCEAVATAGGGEQYRD